MIFWCNLIFILLDVKKLLVGLFILGKMMCLWGYLFWNLLKLYRGILILIFLFNKYMYIYNLFVGYNIK